jgi:drug/metabolite transporter (DMT)-like permease
MDLLGIFSGNELSGWLLVLWVIVMGTIVPYILGLLGLGMLSASTTSVIGMLEPVLAGLFAWWWLGEVLNGVQLLGAIIVLIGIYLADKYRMESEARA